MTDQKPIPVGRGNEVRCACGCYVVCEGKNDVVECSCCNRTYRFNVWMPPDPSLTVGVDLGIGPDITTRSYLCCGNAVPAGGHCPECGARVL